MSGQGQGGFGGGYGGPQQQGGFMQWQPPQGASPMQPGAGGAPQWQQPPGFAQLFGGGNNYAQQMLNSAQQGYGDAGQQAYNAAQMGGGINNGGQSIGYYSGRGSGYGAPYGTFPGGMGGSGGNMWPGPVSKGPIADPAPGAGAMGGAMTPVVNKDPAFSAQNAALNFGNGVNNGYFSWGGR